MNVREPRRRERLLVLAPPLVVGLLLVLQAAENHRFARRQLGVYFIEQEGILQVLDVVSGGAAESAGLRRGDLVVGAGGRPAKELDDVERAVTGSPPDTDLTFLVQRGSQHLEVSLRPGGHFPLFEFLIAALVALCNALVGPLAVHQRPGYLRARLLWLLTTAVAIEVAMPGAVLALDWYLPVSALLNGFQMGVELHLASVIPERQRWLDRAPWAIPAFYVVGLGISVPVAAALVLDSTGHGAALPLPADLVYERFGSVQVTVWVVAVLFLLMRQAVVYPEAKGRQQAALVTLGVLPWAVMVALTELDLLDRLVLPRWEDVVWDVALLGYPLAVFVILSRETANQERILLQLTAEVRRVRTVGEVSRLVSTELHSAFHPKCTHVFYRRRHSGDLTLGHSTGVMLKEEQIPESSALLRLVEAYGEAVDYPADLTGLPPTEAAWLDRLEVDLLVPLQGQDRRLLGLLMLGRKKSEEPYTVRDRRLLQALASQIALVYENVRLTDRVDESRRIQREVMARLGEEELNLVKECPRCGACFDAAEVSCRHDGSELLPSLPVERVIGNRYRLDRLIGRGGMGAIYEAADLHLRRQVAVKVLLGNLMTPEVVRRFEREAHVTAGLRHPNIVTVYDYGATETGGAYLAMELLEGRTLRQAIDAESRLAPERLAPWFEEICEAVEAAHRAGVVHRDLKPANVFIAREGERETVKILDFGVARVSEEALCEAGTLTTPGALVGTFNYMAPEQLCFEPADARSDVFAIGVLCAEALTGRRPFLGETPAELMAAIQKGDFEVPEEGPAGARLRQALARALAAIPSLRFPSAEALRRDLVPALRGDAA